MNLHRFWFKFGSVKPYDSLGLGFGVTARDYRDAMKILRETIFAGAELPPIASFIQDVE